MFREWMKEIPVLEDVEIKFNPDEYAKYWEVCPHCGRKLGE